MTIRIIRIPFTGSVKLRYLLLKTGPTDNTPVKVALVRTAFTESRWILRRRFVTSTLMKILLTLMTSVTRNPPKNLTSHNRERLENMH